MSNSEYPGDLIQYLKCFKVTYFSYLLLFNGRSNLYFVTLRVVGTPVLLQGVTLYQSRRHHSNTVNTSRNLFISLLKQMEAIHERWYGIMSLKYSCENVNMSRWLSRLNISFYRIQKCFVLPDDDKLTYFTYIYFIIEILMLFDGKRYFLIQYELFHLPTWVVGVFFVLIFESKTEMQSTYCDVTVESYQVGRKFTLPLVML